MYGTQFVVTVDRPGELPFVFLSLHRSGIRAEAKGYCPGAIGTITVAEWVYEPRKGAEHPWQLLQRFPV
jgi:hypothetical protein